VRSLSSGFAVGASLVALLACTGSVTPPQTASSLRLAPPSRGIQIRATFDKDPSVYIGRFIPDSVKDADVDENTALATRCSKYIKPKYVEAAQDMDESMYVSHKAAASLGLPAIASVNAASDGRDEVRVRYKLTKKVQSEIDADGLAQCCQADSSQCSSRIIGEFLEGTGEVFQSARESDGFNADVKTPKPVTASASYDSDASWKKKTSFKDVYFAFVTQTTSLTGGKTAVLGDCSFCDAIPGSLDGKYFCGVSSDAPDETSARTQALRSAREQVVLYLGQSLSIQSKSVTALADAAVDQEIVQTVAQGIASLVKDEKWCQQRIPTPDGEKVRSKVLVFYPKSSEDAGKRAVTEAVTSGKKHGK